MSNVHEYEIFREAPAVFRIRDVADKTVCKSGYPVARFRTRQQAEDLVTELEQRNEETT